MTRVHIAKDAIPAIRGVLLLVVLCCTSFYSYLLFHSLVESITIAVSWAVFLLAWNSRRFLDNDYLLFIGIASLFVGVVDMLHTLAFKGMGIFQGYDANLPTQLWIAGRYLQSFSLLVAPIFLQRKLDTRWAFAIFGTILILLFASVFVWRVFPDAYIEGQGLTPFKIVSEYCVIFIFLAAIGRLWISRKDFDPGVLRYLITSIAATMLAELAFTLYISVYDLSNLAGHLIRLVGVYFLYRAIIVTGLIRPYDLLFRHLRQHETELQASKGQLEATNAQLQSEIAERTAEVRARERAEEALRESEARVRRKLESVLSPEGEIADLELEDIIDAPALQSLVDDFYSLAHIPMSVVDLKGKLLVGVGWQDICMNYHRVHPITCAHCIESDLSLSEGVARGEFRLYKCKNNMWDIATPIMVGDRKIGNVFSGQFFFEHEPIDRNIFFEQARTYGFDDSAYLAALDRVPRLSREAVNTGMAFLTKLADLLSKQSYSNLKLARSLEERETLTSSLQESQETLRKLNRDLELQAEELQAANVHLVEQAEELQVANSNMERILAEEQVARAEAEAGKRALEETRAVVERLNQNLEGRNTELEVANRELESFTYSVSHDLRTPLATIDSLAQMLREDIGEQIPQAQHHLSLILQGVRQMNELIISLLALSRLTRQPVKKERVSMAALVQEALATTREHRRQAVKIEVQQLPDAEADPVLLKQVWVNLIANAVKFTRKCENPRIEIGCKPCDDSDCVYYVRDNGVGFDMEQADRLFGVFQRLHSEEEFEGSGVGLAIVSRIVRRHGGRVWAEGEEGNGATFYFTLGD